MSIKLDWEIEAEQTHTQSTAGEDAESRRKRRRARLRFLLVLFVMLALIGALVGVVVVRLRQVEFQIEQRLRDTVAAEVAALRVGDQTHFLALQRSAADEWYQTQTGTFAQYQALKQTQDINLPGTILDLAVDGQRGRVEVQEIISGVPYARVWYYWRYEDGWRHVPPDYTFWGENRVIAVDESPIIVRYRAVDAPVAQAVSDALESWRAFACSQAGLCEFPAVTVDIVPEPSLDIGWSSVDPSVLMLPSPYTRAARLDMPFEQPMRTEVAELIAARMLADFAPEYPADAYFLKQAVTSWLVERFAGVSTDSYLMNSLANEYGAAAVGRLLEIVVPNTGINVLTQVTGEPLEGMRVDWRDFLTWRLQLENDLIARNEFGAFLNLYHADDPVVRSQAEARFSAGAVDDTPQVISVLRADNETGTPTLRAVTDDGGEVVFRLVNGDWKQAS